MEKKDEIRIEPYSIAEIPKENFKWSDEIEKTELTKKFDEIKTTYSLSKNFLTTTKM